MKALIVILLILLCSFSCEKELTTSCEINQTFTLYLKNNGWRKDTLIIDAQKIYIGNIFEYKFQVPIKAEYICVIGKVWVKDTTGLRLPGYWERTEWIMPFRPNACATFNLW